MSTTLASGQTVTLVSTFGGSLAIALTAPTEALIEGSNIYDRQPIVNRRLIATTTVTLRAGDRVNVTAVNGSVVYALTEDLTGTLPYANETEAEEGASTTAVMTPATTAAAIAAQAATINVTLSEDEILAAAAGGTLSGTPGLFKATGGTAGAGDDNLYWCPNASEAYLVAFGAPGPSLRGVVADWDALYTDIASPQTGDQALVSSLLGLSDITAQYSGGYWRPASDLKIRLGYKLEFTGTKVADGYVTQANWQKLLPAKFLRGIGAIQFDNWVTLGANATGNLKNLSVYLGTTATDTSTGTDQRIIGNDATPIITSGASESTRYVQWMLYRTSATQFQQAAPTPAQGMTGDTITTTAQAAAVTLANGNDVDDEMRLSYAIIVAQATATDIPYLTAEITFFRG